MANYSSNAALSSSSLSIGFTTVNNEGPSVFEPDVILPDHFLASTDGGTKGGERRLMAALLSDGIEAYINQNTGTTVESRRQKGKFNAAEWVEISDDSYVFSFDNVCRSLGINPHYLRLGLTRYLKSTSEWKKIRRPRKRA